MFTLLSLLLLLPVADQTFRKRLLPPWCSLLAHGISLLLFATSAGVSVWIGVGFSSSVALMWLISGIFSFLASFLVWEPLKVSTAPVQWHRPVCGINLCSC